MKVPSQSKLTELRRTFRTALGPSRRVHLFEISVYKSYGVHDRHVMGRLFLSYLDGRVYCCRLCKTHLARLDELISKVVDDSLSVSLGPSYFLAAFRSGLELFSPVLSFCIFLRRALGGVDGSVLLRSGVPVPDNSSPCKRVPSKAS